MKYLEIELHFERTMSRANVSKLKENYSLVMLNKMTHVRDRRRYR
jgi:hypothetical protein